MAWRRWGILVGSSLAVLACGDPGTQGELDDGGLMEGSGGWGAEMGAGGAATASGGADGAGAAPDGSGGLPASGGETGTGGSEASGAGPGVGGAGAASSGGSPAAGGRAGTGGSSSGGGSGSGTTGGTSSGGNSSGGDAGSGATTGTGGAAACDNSFPAMTCDSLGVWPSDQASAEEEILTLVNEVRLSGTSCGGVAKPAVGALVMDDTLRCAARIHAQDMADRDYFSHATFNPDACSCSSSNECGQGMMCDGEMAGEPPLFCGKGPSIRVVEAGGPTGAGWENIAAGNARAEATMTQWLDSPGHCNNIMDGQLKSLGVGYAKGGSYGHYWVQSFDN